MDSDDDFDVGLPKIREEIPFSKTININEIVSGETQSMTFNAHEEVFSEGYMQQTNEEPKIIHPKTYYHMELNFLTYDPDPAAKVMFGDFSEIEPSMTNVTGDGGVKKLTIRPGTGEVVKKGNIVRVHFLMGAESMDDLIESTYSSGRMKRYRVGTQELLEGMDIALETMRVGEISKFLLTSDYGFGANGVPLTDTDVIPPDSRLMIQIEVFEATEMNRDETIACMSTIERQRLPFEDLFVYTEEIKAEGNKFFLKKEFESAAKYYSDALEAVGDMKPLSLVEKQKYFKIRSQVCTNLAQVYFYRNKLKRCLSCAMGAIDIPSAAPFKGKAHFWCAKALYELGEYKESHDHVMKVLIYTVMEPSIAELKQKVQQKLAEIRKGEQVLCSRMMATSLSD